MEQGIASTFTANYQNTYICKNAVILHNQNSIYQVELNVVLHELNYFTSSQYNNILIFTGSRSSLDALKIAFPLHYIIRKMYNILLSIPNKQVKIAWIKSYVGTEVNERADSLNKGCYKK